MINLKRSVLLRKKNHKSGLNFVFYQLPSPSKFHMTRHKKSFRQIRNVHVVNELKLMNSILYLERGYFYCNSARKTHNAILGSYVLNKKHEDPFSIRQLKFLMLKHQMTDLIRSQAQVLSA